MTVSVPARPPAASGSYKWLARADRVCMVATATVATVSTVTGALIVALLYLVYAYGKYNHSRQSGVVDMHDYQDTRLQMLSADATERLTDEAADEVDDDHQAG